MFTATTLQKILKHFRKKKVNSTEKLQEWSQLRKRCFLRIICIVRVSMIHEKYGCQWACRGGHTCCVRRIAGFPLVTVDILLNTRNPNDAKILPYHILQLLKRAALMMPWAPHILRYLRYLLVVYNLHSLKRMQTKITGNKEFPQKSYSI